MPETRLSGVPMFRSLGQERLARLEQRLEERQLGSNEIVFRQGDPSDGLYVVVRGGVVIRSETPGSAVERVRDLRPGEVFGETAALLDAPRRFAARTVGETVLWKIPQDLVLELVDDPALETFLPSLMARRRPARKRSYAAPWTRKEPRIWVDREVQLSLDHGERVHVHLENLSAGGACLLAAPDGWQVAQRFGLGLGIDGRSDLLRVRGIVRWRQGRSVGLAFDGDGPAHRRRVDAALRVLAPTGSSGTGTSRSRPAPSP
jgi:Cyclic nucleotide-binding domain/PilZ domain